MHSVFSKIQRLAVVPSIERSILINLAQAIFPVSVHTPYQLSIGLPSQTQPRNTETSLPSIASSLKIVFEFVRGPRVSSRCLLPSSVSTRTILNSWLIASFSLFACCPCPDNHGRRAAPKFSDEWNYLVAAILVIASKYFANFASYAEQMALCNNVASRSVAFQSSFVRCLLK